VNDHVVLVDGAVGLLSAGHFDLDGRCQKSGALVLVDDPALALEIAIFVAGVLQVLPFGRDDAGRQGEVGGGGVRHLAEPFALAHPTGSYCAFVARKLVW
jgi:hypothetical protein